MQAAEAYYEFVTNEESIAYASHHFYRIPSRNDIPTELLPQWIQDLEIKKMEMDWALVEQNSQEWMEHWDNHIRGGQ